MNISKKLKNNFYMDLFIFEHELVMSSTKINNDNTSHRDNDNDGFQEVRRNRSRRNSQSSGSSTGGARQRNQSGGARHSGARHSGSRQRNQSGGARHSDARHSGSRQRNQSSGARHQRQQRQRHPKLMMCTTHLAFTCGVCADRCSRGARRCGFAHHMEQQDLTPAIKFMKEKIDDAMNPETDSNLADFSLLEGEYLADAIAELERRSKMCWRETKLKTLIESSEATKADICPGGLNCMAGVHDASWLICEQDWKTGDAPEDAPGIKLTQYGLVPLATQQKQKDDAIKDAERMKALAELMESAPLGDAAKIAAPAAVWGSGKVDWNDKFANKEPMKPKAKHGQFSESIDGETYNYFLEEGEKMEVINGKPHKLRMSESSLNSKSQLWLMSRIYSEEDKARLERDAKMIPKMPVITQPKARSAYFDEDDLEENIYDENGEDCYLEDEDYNDAFLDEGEYESDEEFEYYY